VVGVSWNGSEAEMAEFVARHDLTFPQLQDDDGAVFAHFDVPVQPAWAFVAADGTTEVHLGAYDDEALAEALTELVAA
jgi:peroxiredoxin